MAQHVLATGFLQRIGFLGGEVTAIEETQGSVDEWRPCQLES